MSKIKVGIVGMGFGAEFIPIYNQHPLTECYAICQRNKDSLNEIGDKYSIKKRFTDFNEMLEDSNIDAIHINTPISDHAWMSLKSLKAGKHTACTVPMSIKVDECLEIVEAEKKSGKVYMMMETAVYTREFLYVRDIIDSGKLGKIQFLRGSHQQNMGLPGWPDYWYGFPPMYYATHCIGPLAVLSGCEIDSVICYGSGKIDEEYTKKYNSPFAVETSHLKFKDSDLIAEVTRSLFNTIRQYRESFDVYGTKLSFEWEQLADEGGIIFSDFEDAERIKFPDRDDLLPKEIKKFTLSKSIEDDEHVSFIQGAGHGGSHPHLVNEFVEAISNNRSASVDSVKAANWTIAGILSHLSAIKGGKDLEIPKVER